MLMTPPDLGDQVGVSGNAQSRHVPASYGRLARLWRVSIGTDTLIELASSAGHVACASAFAFGFMMKPKAFSQVLHYVGYAKQSRGSTLVMSEFPSHPLAARPPRPASIFFNENRLRLGPTLGPLMVDQVPVLAGPIVPMTAGLDARI